MMDRTQAESCPRIVLCASPLGSSCAVCVRWGVANLLMPPVRGKGKAFGGCADVAGVEQTSCQHCVAGRPKFPVFFSHGDDGPIIYLCGQWSEVPVLPLHVDIPVCRA